MSSIQEKFIGHKDSTKPAEKPTSSTVPVLNHDASETKLVAWENRARENPTIQIENFAQLTQEQREVLASQYYQLLIDTDDLLNTIVDLQSVLSNGGLSREFNPTKAQKKWSRWRIATPVGGAHNYQLPLSFDSFLLKILDRKKLFKNQFAAANISVPAEMMSMVEKMPDYHINLGTRAERPSLIEKLITYNIINDKSDLALVNSTPAKVYQIFMGALNIITELKNNLKFKREDDPRMRDALNRITNTRY